MPLPARAAGTTAAEFLQLGFGARAIGMGEAFVADADDASALYYNPAGLASGRLGANEALLGYALDIQDIDISQAAFIHRNFGVSVTYLGVNGIEARTAETDLPTGTFGASDASFGVSYGRPVGPIDVGVTGKVIRQTIANESAAAVAADAGVLYRLPHSPLSFGVSLANLGSSIKFVDEGFPLPMTLRVGGSWLASSAWPATFSVQGDFARGVAPVARVGVEYLGFGPLPLRAGYMAGSGAQRSALLGQDFGNSPTGISSFVGFFMGLGFRMGRLSLDYALLPYGDLGNAHRFSLDVRF